MKYYDEASPELKNYFNSHKICLISLIVVALYDDHINGQWELKNDQKRA